VLTWHEKHERTSEPLDELQAGTVMWTVNSLTTVSDRSQDVLRAKKWSKLDQTGGFAERI
jgi:hypothetical protein